MAYPTANIPNAYQIVGDAMVQGSTLLDKFNDMVAKQQALKLAQIKAEEEAARQRREDEFRAQEMTMKQETFNLDKSEKERKANLEAKQRAALDQIAQGEEIPGMSVGGVIQPDTRRPFSREQNIQKSFEGGLLSAKEYADATKPERQLYRNPLTATSENNTILERDPTTGDWVDTGVPRLDRPTPRGPSDFTKDATLFQQENTLRDEFNKQIATPKAALTAFGKLSQALQRNNPADAYSAIINYVRTLDPNSTVREAEERLARERASGGPLGALGQNLQNLKDGKLTDPIRKNLFDAAKGLAGVELESYNNTRDDYAGRVRSYKERGYNLDESTVLGKDYGQVFNEAFNVDIFKPKPKQNPQQDKRNTAINSGKTLNLGNGIKVTRKK